MGFIMIKNYDEVEEALNQMMIDYDLTTQEMIDVLNQYKSNLLEVANAIKNGDKNGMKFTLCLNYHDK